MKEQNGVWAGRALKGLVVVVLAGLLLGCSDDADKFVYWYEEALQDDGSLIVVKKREIARSGGGWMAGEPGSRTYGYRGGWLEFPDPKTGQPIVWDPGKLYPLAKELGRYSLAQLQPFALHVHEQVPYLFATFYVDAPYYAWGCPLPPYIIWRREGDRWRRIKPLELPQQFKRRNLLPSGGVRIGFVGAEPSDDPGAIFTAEQIANWVKSTYWQVQQNEDGRVRVDPNGPDYTGPAALRYKAAIVHQNVGLVKQCGRGANAPVLGLKNVEMQ